jgi:tetratricopeptide (TPR) repeat protein
LSVAVLFGMGSQAYLYTLAENLVDKMIAWSKECGGKTDADCSRNLTELSKTAFKATEFAQEDGIIFGGSVTDPVKGDGIDPDTGKVSGWRAEWRLYARLFKYHGECFNRYDAKECRAMWTAFEKEEQRYRGLYGEPKRWPDFPAALKHRVFTPIPSKHIGDELAKEWVRIPGTQIEIYVNSAKTRVAAYVPNPNLPPDCVELSPEVKIKDGDFYTEPPQFKPANVPDTCVLVKVYQRGKLLGWLYIEKSDVERLHMNYQKAADQGDPNAETNLGWMYHEGKGVPQDYRKAVELFQKAADQGYAPGQAYLASQYAEGKGVPKDYQKAVELYHKAVNQEPNPYAFNDFAWFLGTCPDDSQRNGKEPVRYATKACELTEWKKANFIGTLAAAYAEIGDFDAAVKYQKQAIAFGSDYPDKQVMEKALKLYQQRKPYRE